MTPALHRNRAASDFFFLFKKRLPPAQKREGHVVRHQLAACVASAVVPAASVSALIVQRCLSGAEVVRTERTSLPAVVAERQSVNPRWQRRFAAEVRRRARKHTHTNTGVQEVAPFRCKRTA